MASAGRSAHIPIAGDHRPEWDVVRQVARPAFIPSQRAQSFTVLSENVTDRITETDRGQANGRDAGGRAFLRFVRDQPVGRIVFYRKYSNVSRCSVSSISSLNGVGFTAACLRQTALA